MVAVLLLPPQNNPSMLLLQTNMLLPQLIFDLTMNLRFHFPFWNGNQLGHLHRTGFSFRKIGRGYTLPVVVLFDVMATRVRKDVLR